MSGKEDVSRREMFNIHDKRPPTEEVNMTGSQIAITCIICNLNFNWVCGVRVGIVVPKGIICLFLQSFIVISVVEDLKFALSQIYRTEI